MIETAARRPSDFDPDRAITHDWGVAVHSKHAADPPLHIVHGSYGDYRTWCGGGAALSGDRNITGRRCSRCLALAWEEAQRCQ